MNTIEKRFQEKEERIRNWLSKKKESIEAPFYTSVDLRNAGFKIGAIDTNFFPAGFNNLCPNYQRKAAELTKIYFQKYFPKARRILLIPENHTRNLYYLTNISSLEKILQNAGYEICTGTINPELTEEETEFQTLHHSTLTLKKVHRKNGTLKACQETSDLILLNNDLSEGVPEILKNISQPIIPSPFLGWWKRRKNAHFEFYKTLVDEFSQLIDLDPWFFYPMTRSLSSLDIYDENDINMLVEEAKRLFQDIEKKYQEYDINEKPYVFIKSATGTYGIGLEKFESVEEIQSMNRRQKNKIASKKGGGKSESFLIQEGIPTIDRYRNAVAEPVIYLIGGDVTGGFFRLNDKKDDRSNLNSEGMKFSKLCFHEILSYHNKYDMNCNLDCLTKIYYTLAEIACIAAAQEASIHNGHV